MGFASSQGRSGTRLESEGSRGCGRYGGARFPGVGGKPVPAEQFEVAGHGREGRLPQMFLRRLPERAARQRPYTKKTTEACKTCLPGDTSFMHLKTGENRKRDVGHARLAERRTSEWQKGRQQFSRTGPRTRWN